MNSVARSASNLLNRQCQVAEILGIRPHQLQQRREIRVKVINGNLDQAVRVLQRKMQSSGIERLIKNEQLRHLKNSEKRVLARKNLEAKLRVQDIARKMKTILIHKVRGL